jgi:hypothetical protein
MGNCIATILVAKWDRALDEKTLYAQVGLRPARAVAVAKPAE